MATTRLGLYGGPRSPYGSFAGKTAEEVIEVAETFSGGFFDYEARRLRPKKKEDKKAAVIIEEVAERIANSLVIETTKEIDLALRLNLEREKVKYKKLYLQWVKQQIKAKEARIKRRKEEETIVMLMLH